MDDLHPKARAVVDAGCGALRARAGDRERIEAALRARLGSSALPNEPGAAPAPRFTGWQVVARVALGAVFVTGAALVALRPDAGAPQPTVQVRAPSPQLALPGGSPPEPEAVAPIATRAIAAEKSAVRRAGGPRSSAGRAGDRLAEEVKLLSRATTQLREGSAVQALKALAEHERKFPNGALREERQAAKVQALCLSGQVDKGRAELARLPQRTPGAARAQQVCAAGSLKTGAQ
jgi:hypothetical protein